MIRRTALILSLVLIGGCQVRGIDLVQDTRLRITAPADRSTVTLPIEVRWTVRDIPPGQRRFLVIVDGSPQPPGKGLDWFARNDDVCRATRGCPDTRYLENNHIFLTRDTSLTIPALAPRADEPAARRHRHDVTVVLVDAQGLRVGEAAAFVEFTVRAA
ncbi:MAG: hypothetical protein WEB06_09980 [Actinomycetota bacterium]